MRERERFPFILFVVHKTNSVGGPPENTGFHHNSNLLNRDVYRTHIVTQSSPLSDCCIHFSSAIICPYVNKESFLFPSRQIFIHKRTDQAQGHYLWAKKVKWVPLFINQSNIFLAQVFHSTFYYENSVKFRMKTSIHRGPISPTPQIFICCE